MEEIERAPQETNEGRDATESSQRQSLDDATQEPVAHIEQAGDFKHAEVIQSSLEAVMATLTTERSHEGTLPAKPEQRDASDVTEEIGKQPDGEDAIPITVPGVRTDAEEVGVLPLPLPRPEEIALKFNNEELGGAVDMPLPGITGEMGKQGEADTLPTPLPIPRPEEIGSRGTVKSTEGAAEMPLPGITGEMGKQGEADNLPGPLPIPRPEEIGSRGTVKSTEGVAEMPLPGTAIDQVIARTEYAVQDRSTAFDLQNLALQEAISHESLGFTLVSNIMKTKHDTAKNSINNIK